MRQVVSDSMTSPVLRSALASHAASIAGCVRVACSPYIKRIDNCQEPHAGSYDEIVREHACLSLMAARRMLASSFLWKKKAAFFQITSARVVEAG